MALFAALTRRAALAGAAASSARLLALQRSAVAAAAALTSSPPLCVLQWQIASTRSFASPAQSKWGVMNDSIKARVVQLVDDNGKVSANVPLNQALGEARKRGVDLVQVSANGEKVVCRMFDAKKRLFSMKKAAKPQKPKQDKEVVFGVKIEEHDIKVKVEQLKKFLAKGHKVKVTVKFAQQYHLKTRSLETLKVIQESVAEDVGVADQAPREQYGGVYIYFAPAAVVVATK